MTPVCAACGACFPDAPAAPVRCPVCDDERQYVPDAGQCWTTPAEIVAGRRVDVRDLEPGLTGIGLEPSFAIGQRLLLVALPGCGHELVACRDDRGIVPEPVAQPAERADPGLGRLEPAGGAELG